MSALFERRHFNCDEYVRMIEIGVIRPEEHVELIGGEIVRMAPERFAMSPQGPFHSGIAGMAPGLLGKLFPSSNFCIRLHSPLRASEEDLPEPDVAVLPGPCRDYQGRYPEKAVLVLEISVTSQQKDRGPKARVYARAGVPEYWVLDVPGRRLEAYQEPSPEGFRLVRFYTDRDTVRPASVPPSIPGDVAVGDLLPPAESRG